ncbi:MAG: UMP kinase, partial [Nanoarchaeota archaeon]|nr:UMP kinase [Nanoarchaeota archaeon]
MKTIVISLGGSLINPNNIDSDFIKRFKSLISTFSKKYKFVIVTGGGNTARIYINALKKEDINEKLQCLIGIRVTRLNAWFMTNFFNGISSKTIAKDLKDVKNLITKNNIIFCGSLRYEEKNTSDGTAAK